jgi:S-formylglutathione hydrolase FrmB
MKKIWIGLLLAFLALALLIGCNRRLNPVRADFPYHDPWTVANLQFQSLKGNLVDDSFVRSIIVYLPPVYNIEIDQPGLINQGFSVLYMLHDFDTDNTSFIDIYKIVQVADELIDEGQIQPMLIVFPDASSLFAGGSFYVNSYLLGDYEDYIIDEVMTVVDTSFHTYGTKPQDTWIPDPRYRAICGLGMGGYGALRIAMDHPDKFAAVSAMSPYASLESFLTREVIDKVYEENGFGSGDFSYASYKSLNPYTDDLHPDKTYSRLVFAMATAFSPHLPGDPDTTNYVYLGTVGVEPRGVDLPFDSTRTIVPGSSAWNRWLQQDVKTRLANHPSAFGDLDMYMECGDQDNFKLYQGTRALSQLLSLFGKENTYVEYSGYPGYPARHDSFIHDRLADILKFHSEHFPPPAYRTQ